MTRFYLFNRNTVDAIQQTAAIFCNLVIVIFVFIFVVFVVVITLLIELNSCTKLLKFVLKFVLNFVLSFDNSKSNNTQSSYRLSIGFVEKTKVNIFGCYIYICCYLIWNVTPYPLSTSDPNPLYVIYFVPKYVNVQTQRYQLEIQNVTD